MLREKEYYNKIEYLFKRKDGNKHEIYLFSWDHVYGERKESRAICTLVSKPAVNTCISSNQGNHKYVKEKNEIWSFISHVLKHELFDIKKYFLKSLTI